MVVPKTEVLVRKGSEVIARHTVQPGDYVIGRDPAAEIRIEGVDQVSRQHAKLIVNYSEVYVEDLGSANGTFVNGKPVTESVKLWPGQQIGIGGATLELHRLKEAADPGQSLAPHSAQVRKLLPEEVRGERKYRIGEVVAQGGMGAILDVQEVPLRRKVAMKVMLEDGDPEHISRFVEEGQITGQLEHPNIVPVYELGVNEHDQPFYTMKFVRGISLRKVLDLLAESAPETVKKFPLNALLTILQKVCDGIAFAHSKKVIHRDLKPDNIMLGEYGEALVMDWGLAKVLGQEPHGRAADGPMQSLVRSVRNEAATGSMTMIGTIMGTPHFMSPEQANGEIDKLDAKTDLDALGAILYQILTLEVPVEGEDIEALLENVRNGKIVSPLKRLGAKKLPHLPSGRVPESLSAVAMKALALLPEHRYAAVQDFQRELAAYQNGFATAAEHAGAWKQVTLFVRRNRAVSLATAVILMLICGFSAKLLIDRGRILSERNRAAHEARRANAALADLKKTAPGLRDLAESEARSQRFDSALAKLDSAIALEPEFQPAYWRRAWLLLGMERFGEAAKTIRAAQVSDPGHVKLAAILPVVEQLAAAPSETERWNPERAAAIINHLRSVGAGQELLALSARFQLGAEEKKHLILKRLDEGLGKARHGAGVDETGLIGIDLWQSPITNLEVLRGLPFDKLNISESKVSDLEPLRGLHLRGLRASKCPITDLSPLAGMPLTEMSISETQVKDLSPLKGMSLTALFVGGTKVVDLSPLRGMPLRTLNAGGTGITDFSPLKGAPLEIFSLRTGNSKANLAPLKGAPLTTVDISYSGLKDLTFLQDSPITDLSADHTEVADLSPIRGKSLRRLIVNNTKISDLSPLRGQPIEELTISGTRVTDFSPLLELPKLERLRVPRDQKNVELLRGHPTLRFMGYAYEEGGLQPVADFWKEYDAMKAAGK